MFNWINQVRKYFQTPVMTLGNAKILTMLLVIHCDEKTDVDREMKLLESLCTLDDNVSLSDMDHLVGIFNSLDRDDLFSYIAEYARERNDKVNLLASAYLIASIDEHVSNYEQQLLIKIGQVLQLTLEEVNMVLQHTAYAVQCFNQWFFLDVPTSPSEEDSVFPEVITRALLMVIYSDDPSDIPNKIDLMRAIFSFDPRLSSVNIEEIRSGLDQVTYSNRIVDEVLPVITDREGQERFISYCFLISLVDGSLSKEEIALIQNLSICFRFSDETVAQLQQRAQSLISTLQELQILQKDLLSSNLPS